MGEGRWEPKKKRREKRDENRPAKRVLSRAIELFTVCLNSLQAISSPRSRIGMIDSDDYGDGDDDNKGGVSKRYSRRVVPSQRVSSRRISWSI